MKITMDWLTQRVEDAPTSYERNLPTSSALLTRMAWQKLKRQAGAEDELWAFTSPSNTWKKQGKHSGYALVREGTIVQSVVVSHE